MIYDCIVIGAGQAGLSTGYYLKKKGFSFLILEKSNRAGSSWLDRYDSLKLFTPRKFNSLPGMNFEGDPYSFPGKDEVAEYLLKYANEFQLPIQYQSEVLQVTKWEDLYTIQTSQNQYQAKNVVIASGAFQLPTLPPFANKLNKDVLQLHSAQYKNRDQLKDGDVIVIGGGNSGAQIATELSKDRPIHLSISQSLKYLPLTIGRYSIFDLFHKLGLLTASNHSIIGQLLKKRGDTIFGYELKHLIKNGVISVYPRAIDAEGDQIFFSDGRSIHVQNVIFSTGFRHQFFQWIKIEQIFTRDGELIHHRGITPSNGLYFVGLPWQTNRSSALLLGVGEDAKFIVNSMNR